MSDNLIFYYTATASKVDPLRIGTPQNWSISALITPSSLIHDVATARSLSGQVNLKTHWSTVEEYTVEIPCIPIGQYLHAQEFAHSIHSQSIDIDASNGAFASYTGTNIIGKLKTGSLQLPPVSKRSQFTSMRFVIERDL